MASLQVAYRVALSVLFVASSVETSAETREDFVISADIVSGCIVTLAGAGNWGQIQLGTVSGLQAGSVEADLVSGAASGIQIECTPGTTLGVTADAGNHALAGGRRMSLSGDSTATIPYQLFADGGTSPWTTQSIPMAFAPGTSKKLLPVRGKATLAGSQRAGGYSDAVRVTLAW